MPTAQELIVAIRSEGVEETGDDLSDMEETFTDTSDSAKDTAEDLEGFTERTKGALGAALVGITALGAGLASQIPILGELSSAFGAVFAAFGFQASQFLRDIGVGRLVDFLFNLSSAVFNAEGAFGDLLGVIGALGAAVGLLIPSLGTLSFLIPGLTTSGAIGFLSGLASTAAGAATALFSLPVAFAALVAGIVGFSAAYALGLGNIKEKTDKTATSVSKKFEGFLKDVRKKLLNLTGGKITGKRITDALSSQFKESKKDGILSWFDGLGTDIGNFIDDIVEDSKKFGGDVIDKAVSSFNNVVDEKGGQILTFFSGVGNDLTGDDGEFSSIVSDSKKFGRDIIDKAIAGLNEVADEKGGQIVGFFTGIKTDLFGDGGEINQILTDLKQFGKDIIQKVIDGLRNAPGSIGDILDEQLPGDISLGELRDSISGNDGGDTAGQSSGASTGGLIVAPGSTGNADVRLDGRRVSQSTGRYREDSTNRRGGI
jgi:hypothetical protein